MHVKTAALFRQKWTGRALVVGFTLVGALGLAGPANAAAPAPFTMTDHVDNNTGVDTFTTSGLLCPSGTFVDDVTAAGFPHSDHSHSEKGFVLIRSTFTCDDGSGSFTMLKHLTLTFTDTGFTDAGPVEILGGTGTYAGITGHGFTSGGTDGETGIGGGTTTGAVQLP
ncbi:hypothetical protein [Pedococcus sp. 5OH_020]|uniref:hypothetical protein n=1 Tax=Pedococcus sp. 5OH_020 TaxID=2989814 RepID=UPI0022E9D728|nr:hypothetical protein [Pedococcus sp. 5OH_020]